MAAILLPNTTNFTAKLNLLRTLHFSTFEAETLLLEPDVLKQNRGDETRNMVRQESKDIMNNLKKYIRELKEVIRKSKPYTKMGNLDHIFKGTNYPSFSINTSINKQYFKELERKTSSSASNEHRRWAHDMATYIYELLDEIEVIIWKSYVKYPINP